MRPLALYVHWPFCKAKCPYCDFNSHVREAVDHAAWRNALITELNYIADKVAPEHQLTSIFFGGGTPSLMKAETVAAVVEAAKSLFSAHPELEITLEANPTSVEAKKFQAFAGAGVNRVSLGVQSLRAESLTFLGREHSADEALAAVKLAAEIFPRYSFDMIYALPNQRVAQWQEELEEALPYMRGHASLYQLTIEPNTAFHHAYHVKRSFKIPEDEQAVALYKVTNALMAQAGMEAYEVSNYARPGDKSRHNLSYWRGESYIGIGPGAHGRISAENCFHTSSRKGLVDAHLSNHTLTLSSPNDSGNKAILSADGQERRIATTTIKSPERWLHAVQEVGHGIEEETALTDRERWEERLIMGLRLQEGIERTVEIDQIINTVKLQHFQSIGLLEPGDARVIPTARGRLVLNALIGEIVSA